MARAWIESMGLTPAFCLPSIPPLPTLVAMAAPTIAATGKGTMAAVVLCCGGGGGWNDDPNRSIRYSTRRAEGY